MYVSKVLGYKKEFSSFFEISPFVPKLWEMPKMTLNFYFTAKNPFFVHMSCQIRISAFLYQKIWWILKNPNFVIFGPYFFKKALKRSYFAIISIILIWFKLELQDVTSLKVVYWLTSLVKEFFFEKNCTVGEPKKMWKNSNFKMTKVLVWNVIPYFFFICQKF